jgi:U3 small nucleolar RNA-associated protein 13
MVMIVESFPVDEEDMPMQGVEESEKLNEKPTLSKSWTEQSAHAPSYSGGKVTLCHTKGTRNLYGHSDNEETDLNSAVPFLLAPCAGDLTLIDAVHGIKARTIREGCANSSDPDDEEDESIDTDAIVAYALAPNDSDLITASRNNILRHYDISGSPSHSYSGVDGRGPAKVRKVLGRSGHDLPVTSIEFHCSGIFFATGSVDGNVKVWDLRGGYATHSFRYHAPGYSTNMAGRGGLRGSITCLDWCPDMTKLWLGVGRDDGSVRVHDLRVKNDEEDVVEMTDHVGAVTCMVWASSNGKGNAFDTFFTAGRDAVVNTWSIQEEERMNLSQSKKQKKNENGEGKRTTHFSKHYFLLLTYPFEFCA